MKEQTSTSKILDSMDEGTKYSTPIFGSEASDVAMPRLKMNDQPVEPRIAYEMIKEYLSIEGNATQNLTTFCQTYMEPMATKIMAETMEKNAIDKDEYPMTADLENRCVAMIGDLWHADPAEEPMGTSTVGSSEACMLGGLGMLFRWKKLAKDAGIDIYTEQRPNLVISAGYQVCWEKFCRYWDIEMRLVPLEKDHLSLNMDTVMDYVDDHTIGITAILGITYTGKFDDVQKLDELVEAYNQEHPKLPIRIHVDGASGGMFAPFVEPDLVWDFQLEERVVHQLLRPQVRPRVPRHRLGGVAQQGGAARGPDLLGELPGRRGGHDGHQLLALRFADRGPVLRADAQRLRGLQGDPGAHARRGALPGRRAQGDGHLRDLRGRVATFRLCAGA